MLTFASIFALLIIFGVSLSLANRWHPQVTTVEKNPSRKVCGSLSIPEGSPWCDGRPTYWLVGHQPTNETPWCLNYETGEWEQLHVAVLDSNDYLNDEDGPKFIDRHECVSLDVNNDDLPDILCIVGANKGQGNGFNELYITQADGMLVKIPDAAGLQKYPGMRTRFVVALAGADGSQLVFIATKGVPRSDGLPNQHRMFRNVRGNNETLFEEIDGPWIQYSDASCAVVADVNGDGLDDLIVCNKNDPAFLFLQDANATWSNVVLEGHKAKEWRSVRVADVTYDGVPDLIVVGTDKESYIRIFEGSKDPPFFNFYAAPFTQYRLPYATPDLEILDVNGDGLLDIYVVQSDERTSGSYCAGKFVHKAWWEKGNQPPPEFVPALDQACDLLLVGRPENGTQKPFRKVYMRHSEPGCGGIVRRFGNQRTLLLAQGNFVRPGHNLLLQWRE